MEEKKKKKKKSFYFPALNEHVEFISFTILIHNQSEDNSVYFSVQLTRLQKKNFVYLEYYFLIYHIEKERGLKKFFLRRLSFFYSFEKGGSFLKTERFFCVHSRVFIRALIAEKKIQKTRETGSRPGFFFFKLKLSYSSSLWNSSKIVSRYFRGQFKFLRAVL